MDVGSPRRVGLVIGLQIGFLMTLGIDYKNRSALKRALDRCRLDFNPILLFFIHLCLSHSVHHSITE